jgi:AraC-like DNA-binding protein
MPSERFGFTEDLGLCDRMGLRPYSIGWQKSAFPLGVPQRRVLPLYEIVFLERGRHYYESAASVVRIAEAGTVFLNFPGVWHRYGPPDTVPATSWWFLFDGAMATRWLEQGLLDPAQPVLALPDPKSFGRLVGKIWHRLGRRGENKSLSASRGIMNLLHELASQIGRRAGEGKDERVRQAIDSMAAAVQAFDFDLPGWCAAAKLDYEVLRKRFKTETGMSPGSYFAQLKLARVKERLAHGKESVSAIAREEGFEDPYYFSRWFKKKERLSPSAYATLLRA